MYKALWGLSFRGAVLAYVTHSAPLSHKTCQCADGLLLPLGNWQAWLSFLSFFRGASGTSRHSTLRSRKQHLLYRMEHLLKLIMLAWQSQNTVLLLKLPLLRLNFEVHLFLEFLQTKTSYSICNNGLKHAKVMLSNVSNMLIYGINMWSLLKTIATSLFMLQLHLFLVFTILRSDVETSLTQVSICFLTEPDLWL